MFAQSDTAPGPESTTDDALGFAESAQADIAPEPEKEDEQFAEFTQTDSAPEAEKQDVEFAEFTQTDIAPEPEKEDEQFAEFTQTDSAPEPTNETEDALEFAEFTQADHTPEFEKNNGDVLGIVELGQDSSAPELEPEKEGGEFAEFTEGDSAPEPEKEDGEFAEFIQADRALRLDEHVENATSLTREVGDDGSEGALAAHVSDQELQHAGSALEFAERVPDADDIHEPRGQAVAQGNEDADSLQGDTTAVSADVEHTTAGNVGSAAAAPLDDFDASDAGEDAGGVSGTTLTQTDELNRQLLTSFASLSIPSHFLAAAAGSDDDNDFSDRELGADGASVDGEDGEYVPPAEDSTLDAAADPFDDGFGFDPADAERALAELIEQDRKAQAEAQQDTDADADADSTAGNSANLDTSLHARTAIEKNAPGDSAELATVDDLNEDPEASRESNAGAEKDAGIIVPAHSHEDVADEDPAAELASRDQLQDWVAANSGGDSSSDAAATDKATQTAAAAGTESEEVLVRATSPPVSAGGGEVQRVPQALDDSTDVQDNPAADQDDEWDEFEAAPQAPLESAAPEARDTEGTGKSENPDEEDDEFGDFGDFAAFRGADDAQGADNAPGEQSEQLEFASFASFEEHAPPAIHVTPDEIRDEAARALFKYAATHTADSDAARRNQGQMLTSILFTVADELAARTSTDGSTLTLSSASGLAFFGPSKCKTCEAPLRFLTRICLVCGEKVSGAAAFASDRDAVSTAVEEMLKRTAEWDLCEKTTGDSAANQADDVRLLLGEEYEPPAPNQKQAGKSVTATPAARRPAPCERDFHHYGTLRCR